MAWLQAHPAWRTLCLPLAVFLLLSTCGLLAFTAVAPSNGMRRLLAEVQQHSSPSAFEEGPQLFEIPMQLPSWAWCNRPACQYSRLRPDPAAIKQGIEFTSQREEDQWLSENVFFGQASGFYLEMGALDGVRYSNSRWFAEAAGWRGLLIEPSPESYAKLVGNRRESICVNAAVCASYQRVHYLSGKAAAGIYEFMSESFRRKWHPGAETTEGLPEVPCLPLMAILDRLGIGTIDLWSLDVEGAELEVLKTIEFSRLRVNVVVVETDCHDPAKSAAVVGLLEGAGFLLVREQKCRNSYFVHHSFLPRVAARPPGAAA